MLRTAHDDQRKTEHGRWRWAHVVNIGLGSWLLTQPVILGVQEPGLRAAEMAMGVLLMVAAGLALSWRAVWGPLAVRGHWHGRDGDAVSLVDHQRRGVSVLTRWWVP